VYCSDHQHDRRKCCARKNGSTDGAEEDIILVGFH
jgi:hypothetical protein